jgi:hypothetical protein
MQVFFDLHLHDPADKI